MNAETLLRNEIRDALQRCGVLVFVNAQVGRTYKGGLGTGSADLIACVKGRFVAIEVKLPNVAASKPSVDQLAWGDTLREHGGVYAVVRTVADAINVCMSVKREAA